MQLLKIGELARRSGVPIATLKHYVREGLISPTRKSGRTMSWYDPSLATKVKAIKELQKRAYLPLDVIRETIDKDAEAPDDLTAAEAILRVLARHAGRRARTREEVLARGATVPELDLLAAAGLALPSLPDAKYRGDDLALLTVLGAARRAGISAEMLPFEIINDYLAALRTLAAVELRLFREGVIKRAPAGDVARLTTVATRLSERLVVLVRRKLLLPTLQRLIEEEAHAPEPIDHPAPRSTPPRSTPPRSTPPRSLSPRGQRRGVRRKLRPPG